MLNQREKTSLVFVMVCFGDLCLPVSEENEWSVGMSFWCAKGTIETMIYCLAHV